MRSVLPSGTVTFLFTDVEGSTTLLHELGPEGYAAALAEHRRLVREACAAEDGVEVDTQGDAFFFAFPRAARALRAAEAMTKALAEGPIQLRIGLHTGEPVVTEEGYVGEDVHLAARVAASAHGGQVVLSAATAALVEAGGSKPEASPLLDLGKHRLKDIEGPVAIYQLGEGSFPPLKTISNTNLPRPASSFVGRERELGEVLSRVEQGARLLTLTGPGGSGKTRLALEAATTLVPEYKAGTFWVGLAALRDPALVSGAIAQILGAKDGLAEHVGERELLLLLDNVEQVIEAAPELASLLERCANLTLLVTSRELLRVGGEVEYAVPPLAEPEAVALFCERSGLEATDEIAELCARLDNLPLAVELAAARTKALSPAQILERLSQRLDLLKGGRDAHPRQQTLRATIAWSYDLLAGEEQRLFRRLSVFAGGCTLEAAEEVAEADLDTLQSLVEKSLLRFSSERYWMLETVREFAGDRLVSAGESDNARERHASYVIRLAEGGRERLRDGDRETVNRLARELDNVRAALAWLALREETVRLLDLFDSMYHYWRLRGGLREGRRWAEEALARATGDDERRARLLFDAAGLAHGLGDAEAARVYAEESLAIYRVLGSSGDLARILNGLGGTMAALGEYEQAGRLFEEAAVHAREAGDATMAVVVATNHAELLLETGDYEGSITRAFESVTRAREAGHALWVGRTLQNLAVALYLVDRNEEAWTAASESLAIAHAIGDAQLLFKTFDTLGALLARRGEEEHGVRLLGAADALSTRTGYAREGVDRDVRRNVETDLLQSIGKSRYETALAEGQALSLDEAVELALGLLS